jgi:hypothetical protein
MILLFLRLFNDPWALTQYVYTSSVYRHYIRNVVEENEHGLLLDTISVFF